MTTCPQCKRLSRPVVITEEVNKFYTFRKYFCTACNETFHTHEYMQNKRSEKALQHKLSRLQDTVMDVSSASVMLNERLRQLMLELS